MDAGVVSETIATRRPRSRIAAAVIAAALVVGGGVGVFIHLVQTGEAGKAGAVADRAAPAASSAEGATALQRGGLYGQATWAVGSLRAPAISGVRDQHGHAFSLSSLQGQTVALTFLNSRCSTGCAPTVHSVVAAERALPVSERPTLLVVSTSAADGPAAVRAAARRDGLATLGKWDWVTGTRAQLAPIWQAYRVRVGIAAGGGRRASREVYLLDRHGFQRAGFVYPFTSRYMASDMRTLAQERG